MCSRPGSPGRVAAARSPLSPFVFLCRCFFSFFLVSLQYVLSLPGRVVAALSPRVSLHMCRRRRVSLCLPWSPHNMSSKLGSPSGLAATLSPFVSSRLLAYLLHTVVVCLRHRVPDGLLSPSFPCLPLSSFILYALQAGFTWTACCRLVALCLPLSSVVSKLGLSGRAPAQANPSTYESGRQTQPRAHMKGDKERQGGSNPSRRTMKPNRERKGDKFVCALIPLERVAAAMSPFISACFLCLPCLPSPVLQAGFGSPGLPYCAPGCVGLDGFPPHSRNSLLRALNFYLEPILSRDGLALSPDLFPHTRRAEMFWLGQLFVPPLFPPTRFLMRLLGWMLSRDGLAWSALCLPMCFHLSPHLYHHALAICLPTHFLMRLLGWMLSRDGLAWSALRLPMCFHLSPHLYHHALAICLPTHFLMRLLGWMLSRDGLAWSALRLPMCFHLSTCIITRLPFVSPLISSCACWAGCSREMVWLGQLFVSPCVSICLPTCIIARLPFVSPLISSCACWAGCSREMVWLGQLFVSPCVSICSLVSSHACHSSPHSFPHALAGLDALARWSGLVSSLSPHVFPFVSRLVSSRACHLSPHSFPHALAGLDALAKWSGLVSSLSPHVFPFVSPLVSSRACRAKSCHEIWLSQVFRLSPHSCPHALAGLDALARWCGLVSSLSPHVNPLVFPLVFSRACRGRGCHAIWLNEVFHLSSHLLPHALAGWSALCLACLPTCFINRLLGRMLSRHGLAQSALCVSTIPSYLLGWTLS